MTPGSQPILINEQNPQAIRAAPFDSEDNNLYSLNFHFRFVVDDNGDGHFNPGNELKISYPYPFNATAPTKFITVKNDKGKTLTTIEKNIKCSEYSEFCAEYFSNLPLTAIQISVASGSVLIGNFAIMAVYLKPTT